MTLRSSFCEDTILSSQSSSICCSRLSRMNQKLVDGDTPFLPEEIVRNILKRLPVTTLIRFRCVCKHWKNLFQTPSFIEDHIRHSRQKPSLLFEGYSRSNHLLLSLLDHEMQVREVQSSPLINSFCGARIVGSCNGLLCVQLHNASILLWNPSVREVRQVSEAINFFDTRRSYVGFGFSSMLNDYKIVRIYDFTVEQVQVFSLSTGTWKDVEFGNLDGVHLRPNGFTTNGAIDGVALCSESNGITTNDAIFWFGFKNVGEEAENCYLVVSFDIALEVFTLIPFPTSAPNSFSNKLVVHQNKLAMLSETASENYESSIIDLWVMEESAGASGERWIWTKKCSTSPYPSFLLPGTIWNNVIVCDFVATGPEVKNDDTRKVVLFNLTSYEFKMFAIWRYGFGDRIFNYVESLIPTGNNHIQEL